MEELNKNNETLHQNRVYPQLYDKIKARNQKSEVYSLRWHYPNQVIRVRATQPNLSPLQARAPLWFCFQLWFIIRLCDAVFNRND